MWQAILCSLGPCPRSTWALQKGLATPEGFGHPRSIWSPQKGLVTPGELLPRPSTLSDHTEPSQYIPFGEHPPPLASGLAPAALHGEAHMGVTPLRPRDALTMGVGSLGVLVGSPGVLVGSPGVRVGSLGVRDAVLVSPTSRGAGLQRVNS